jgi:ribosomal protein S18 acetylase RimI-like enzyme
VIRPATSSDLGSIVEIHLRSFPGFFLTFLGKDFLALLYKNIQSDPEGVVLVAVSGEQIEGFVAGVLRQEGFYRRLIRKQKWAFAVAALKGSLKRPAILPRLLRALQQPEEAEQASAQACLMSIAVRPESQGQGIGQQLVKEFCQELAQRGVRAVCLTTDRNGNEPVNHFYRGLGFRLSRSYVTPEGRAMNEYAISLE